MKQNKAKKNNNPKKHQTQMVKNETEKQVHEFNAHTSTHTPIYIHLKNEEKKTTRCYHKTVTVRMNEIMKSGATR